MSKKDLQNGFILGAALQGKTEAIEPQGEIEITENGEYNVADYATANVSVSSTIHFVDSIVSIELWQPENSITLSGGNAPHDVAITSTTRITQEVTR